MNERVSPTTFGSESDAAAPLKVAEIPFEQLPVGVAVFGRLQAGPPRRPESAEATVTSRPAGEPPGAASIDEGLVLRGCNPPGAELVRRYARAPLSSIRPGVRLRDPPSAEADPVFALLRRALNGEVVREYGVLLGGPEELSYWDLVSSPLREGEALVGVVLVGVEATKRVQQEEARRERQLAADHRALERHAEERERELSTLLEVSRNVTSTLDLEPLLGVILEQLGAVVDYTGAWISRLEGADLRTIAHRGPVPQDEAARLSFLAERALIDREVIRGRRLLIIPDVLGDDPLAQSFRESAGERLHTTFSYIRSWMSVPLVVKERVIGKLTLDHREPNHYTTRHAELALAFANQAAVAIENASLYEHARESAAAAERNRLARDLHDAVTQTLFSASLIAEVLPRLWERSPDEVRRRLEELRQLTRGALAEMRTLLLELRPHTLTEVPLESLLGQLAEATTGRARIPVRLEVSGPGDLPPEVSEGLYRIAQEALNNVAKHSGASRAAVRLRRVATGQVELAVDDDGRGFDLTRVRPNSLGLGIMRERAELIGARLEIRSEPGHGTRIVALWQDGQAAEG